MINFRPDGIGHPKLWAGELGYEWTIHLDGPAELAGAVLAVRVDVQLELAGASVGLGPVTTKSIVKLVGSGNGVFGWLSVVVPITSRQIQSIESQRNGGSIRARLTPSIDWSSPEVRSSGGAVTFGEHDQDGSWWRRALDGWQWGTSLVHIVRRPPQPTSPALHRAYERLVAAQVALRSGPPRIVATEVRAVFEILKSIERGSESKGRSRTVPERWWDVAPTAQAMFDVASAAAHPDLPVRDHAWTRIEAESLVAMAAALLNVAMLE